MPRLGRYCPQIPSQRAVTHPERADIAAEFATHSWRDIVSYKAEYHWPQHWSLPHFYFHVRLFETTWSGPYCHRRPSCYRSDVFVGNFICEQQVVDVIPTWHWLHRQSRETQYRLAASSCCDSRSRAWSHESGRPLVVSSKIRNSHLLPLLPCSWGTYQQWFAPKFCTKFAGEVCHGIYLNRLPNPFCEVV